MLGHVRRGSYDGGIDIYNDRLTDCPVIVSTSGIHLKIDKITKAVCGDEALR